MKKKLTGLLLTAAMGMSICTGAFADELQAPSDFTYDPSSGAISFVSNDENAGYYFVRVYPVVNGEEAAAYVSSSKRINAGKAGEKSGSVDTSSIGWGLYHIKLATFAASGTDYTAPDPIILDAYYGVGGKLEKPEMMVVADGNTAEITLDHYTLTDWLTYQYMPTVCFSLYADEACTELVDSVEVATSEIVYDTHPTGNKIWPYSLTSGHANYAAEAMPGPGGEGGGEPTYYCLTPEASFTVEEAGTYYVTAQAISEDEERIASSEVSDVIAVELTTEEPNAVMDNHDITILTSSLWENPGVMGMPTAGTMEGRVDSGLGQETTAVVE